MVLAPPYGRGWTIADLDGLPDDGLRYELVDGALHVTPPPSQWHQHLASALRDLLQGAAPPGWRCRVEWPLPLAEDTLRIADGAAYRWPPRHPRDDPHSPVGPSDVGLVVEVVSPSSRRTDRFGKPGEYAEAGIPLFWRLETEHDLLLLAFTLRGSGYEQVAQIDGRAAAPVPWGELVVDVPLLDG